MSVKCNNHFLFSDACYYDLDANTITDISTNNHTRNIPISGEDRIVLRKLIEDYPKSVHKETLCKLIGGTCGEERIRKIIDKLKKKHKCLKEWLPRASQGEYRLQNPNGSNRKEMGIGREQQSVECTLKSTGICVRPNFVKEARQDIFAALDESFDESHVVFLQGIGGIGKSETAKHWALQKKKKEQLFDTVVFAQLNTESENSNVQSLVVDDTVFVISGAFRSRDEGESTESYFQRKLAKIKQIADERTLIIIDNYDIDDPKLVELFTGPYRLLVTTRNKQAGYDFPLIPITEIQEADYLKDIFFKNLGDERDDIDREDPCIEKLFELVSNHTLTIEILAKALVNSSDTPETLYQKIGYPGQHTLMRNVDGLVVRNFSEKALTSYECIRRLFNLSRLEQDEDFEYKSQVLVFLAAMPTRGIELSLFKKWSDNRIIRAKNSLVQKSWLRQDIIKGVKLISMHPLIREIVWSELEPSLDKCSIIADKCFGVGWLCNDELYHLPKHEKNAYEQSALSLLSAFPIQNLSYFEFHMKIQRVLHACANFEIALQMAEKMKMLMEQEGMQTTWGYGFLHFRIAAVYVALRKPYDDFETHFCMAERLMRATSYTSEEIMWLAYLYREKASARCQDVYLFQPHIPEYTATIEMELDNGDALIAVLQQRGFNGQHNQTYYGTTGVWRSKIEVYRGNLDRAIKLIDSAEAVFIRLGYPNAIDKAAVEDIRALIYAKRGEYSKEVESLRKATNAFVNGFSEYHRASIERAIKLANAYRRNGQLDKAKEVLIHYQSIAEEMLGSNAELSITIRNRLIQLNN